MKNFDGIIFDIDGTLASTHQLIFASFNHISQKFFNKKMTNDEILAMFGPTEDVILKAWMKGDYNEARKAYYDFYESRHDDLADIFPGLIEIIDNIKSKNVVMGIFTGKGKSSSIITLKAFGIENNFDLIITGDDVLEHKPSPEGINKFLEKFKLDKQKVLMVGDAHVDVLASRGSGVKCASVLWDSYHKDEVLKLNPDYIFYTVKDFADFIDNNI